MKKVTFLLVLLMSAAGANAIGIKLYIGSVEKVTKDFKTAHFLKLVVCNNTTDTVYIPKHQLEHVQPSLTNDVTLLTDGGAFIMLANVPALINDMVELASVVPPPGRFEQPPVTELDKQRKAANAQLPAYTFSGADCFVFAPGSCLTINSLLLTFPGEYMKLVKINELQQQQMEANLVVPVEYYTNRNATGKNVILISRSSLDIKTAVLEAAEKK